MIRPATSDDALDAVPLILEAIGSIAFVLTGTKVLAEAMSILEQFFEREGNRVSYENTLIIEESGANAGDRRIIGVAISYDGSVARKLDEPLEEAAKLQSGSPEYRIPTEAESDEFYLDTVSVNRNYQGRGIGRRLIEAVCEKGRQLGRNRVGLLVDVTNPDAKRLYERLQFRVNKQRELAGEDYFHMIRDL
ncbi:MAG: GNAT family N-acetyltransferase [Verrucomicrobia bacterium]|nr:GNAT family N-acetyltransferase [Verrucomicrobiota bacterium]